MDSWLTLTLWNVAIDVCNCDGLIPNIKSKQSEGEKTKQGGVGDGGGEEGEFQMHRPSSTIVWKRDMFYAFTYKYQSLNLSIRNISVLKFTSQNFTKVGEN